MNKLRWLIFVFGISSCSVQLVDADTLEPGKKATLQDLASYVPKGRQKEIPGVRQDASGLTYSRHTRTFFVITDQGRIVEFTRDNRLKRTFQLHGFVDPEGIAHIEGNTFAIVEEDRGTISIATLDAKTRQVRRDSSTEIKVYRGGGNNGLEGLAYDHASRTFFVVKEKRPRKIFKVTRSGKVSTPWDAESRSLGMKDLSDVFFDAGSGHLILLSHKSRVAVECTTNGREIARLPLKLVKAEGVAMDDEGNLFVCGEPNSLQVFEKSK